MISSKAGVINIFLNAQHHRGNLSDIKIMSKDV